MSRDARLLYQAFKKTYDSKHRVPIAAIIAVGSRIISQGINRYKTHPQQQFQKREKGTSGGHIHAELDAILSVPKDVLAKSTIYIVRRRKDGSFGLAKPCSACRRIIQAANIKRVVYSTSDKTVWFTESVE